MSNSNTQIVTTIINQLGGQGKLRAMVGVTSYVYDSTEGKNNWVMFDFKGNRKMKTCTITLNGLDLYDIKFTKLNMKTFDLKVVAEFKNIYCDQLKPIFEETTGLYLSL